MMLERGESRLWRCFGRGCWREERRDLDGVSEQVAREKRGHIVMEFVNRVLERGEDGV